MFRWGVLLAVVLSLFGGNARAAEKPPAETAHHLVILGDPHLPGREIDKKIRALETINSWKDVEMVVAVGDICAGFGTAAEYKAAQAFFHRLRVPFLPVAGNHDVMYADPVGAEHRLVVGNAAVHAAKLARFRHTFGLASPFYSRRVGRYLLVFLSVDHPVFLAGLSKHQLTWLQSELQANARRPTIIIFHGPLAGSLRGYRHWINSPNFIAQPTGALHEILKANRQVFLWVSGHTHTPPWEESYASPVNLYDGRVVVIHNTDMNHGVIWTNSLYLYPDRVVVKTYNHQSGKWLPRLERVVRPPGPVAGVSRRTTASRPADEMVEGLRDMGGPAERAAAGR